MIAGDRDGLLKLLVSVEDRSVLGVHVLGTSATDLVHIGQAVMAMGAGGLDFLVTAVFNYPTFAESYKVAALDADNRIKAMKSFSASGVTTLSATDSGRRARGALGLLEQPLVDDRLLGADAPWRAGRTAAPWRGGPARC